MAIKYPELDDEQRQKILDREEEEKRQFSSVETLRINEYIKNLNRKVSLEKMLKELGFSHLRSSKVFQFLKEKPEVNLEYRKGEWFIERD